MTWSEQKRAAYCLHPLAPGWDNPHTKRFDPHNIKTQRPLSKSKQEEQTTSIQGITPEKQHVKKPLSGHVRITQARGAVTGVQLVQGTQRRRTRT